MQQSRTPGARTIDVPMTPTYFAQASAYHSDMQLTAVHSRKSSSLEGNKSQRGIGERVVMQSFDESWGWKMARDIPPRGSLSRRSLTIKPGLQIRTTPDRPDSGKVFQTLLSAPPIRHMSYSALSPFSQPPASHDSSAVSEDLETGEAFEAFDPKEMGRKASVAQKLAKAWPWEWKPSLQTREPYMRLRDEYELPTMVSRSQPSKIEKTLLGVFVVLLSVAVVLQLAIIFGIGGLGCSC
ncbi:MAG: hypothetical protein Q9159_001139 [Coniocarpon cinnabarinum]